MKFDMGFKSNTAEILWPAVLSFKDFFEFQYQQYDLTKYKIFNRVELLYFGKGEKFLKYFFKILLQFCIWFYYYD